VIAGRAVALTACLLAAAATPALAQHQHEQPPKQQPQPADPHAGHAQPATAPAAPATSPPDAAPLPPFIPPVTDADRAAAFPDVDGHMVHDGAVHAYVLFDELEWRAGRDVSGGHWDVDGWIGGDRDRLWVRAEGVGESGRLEEAHGHVLWGRPIARWWDVVAGVRQDLRPGDAQTWAAFGFQGLAPYRIDVEVTGYLGGDGRSQLRVDAAHDLRLTRRVVAQTRLEAMLAGKADPAREIGAGLSNTEFGIRVRYEFRRDLAPYAGVTWHRTYYGTADHHRVHGEPVATGRAVIGLRVWR
jgi:copper resistance protein B